MMNWSNFEFHNPEFLWLLILVPLVAVWSYFMRKKETAVLTVSSLKGFGTKVKIKFGRPPRKCLRKGIPKQIQSALNDRVLRFFVWHLQGFGSIPHMIPLSNSKFALVFESFNKF